MDPDLARWLAASPEVLDEAAAQLSAADALAAGSRLRASHPELSAAQAAAALEQADLRALAGARYGIDARGLLLTRDGLEQATRPHVAQHRARLLAGSGARRVVDLTAGLGLDSRAFAAAGLQVTAIERDPGIAVLLAHNLPDVRVINADATSIAPALLGELEPTDVVFVDPARRDPGGPRDARTARSRPERDPERWSPPWSFIAELPHPRIAVKAAPSFTPPKDWAKEWLSINRTVVECACYSWPIFDSPRAVVIDRFEERVFHPGTVEIAQRVGAFLHEPDPAIIRAGASLGPDAVDESRTWLTGDEASADPVLRSYRVITELTGPTKQQRRTLADLRVNGLTIKGKGSNPAAVLHSLGQSEGGHHVLVVLPSGTWLTERAGSPQDSQE